MICSKFIIYNRLRTRYALEFLSAWEEINNSNFKVVESDHFILEISPTFYHSLNQQAQYKQKGRFMKITDLKSFS